MTPLESLVALIVVALADYRQSYRNRLLRNEEEG